MKKHSIDILDQIGPWGCTAKDVIAGIAARGDAEEIEVNINSPGGDVMEGMGMFNALSSCPVPVTAKITAFAASMATVVACSAKKCTMPKNGFFVIHNPWSCAMGEAADFEHTAEVLTKMQTMVCGIYAKRTGKPAAELQAMMNAETWMTGEEAKAAGFVDEVSDELAMVACLSPAIASRFAKMPAAAAGLVLQPVDIETKLRNDYEAQLKQQREDATLAQAGAITATIAAQQADHATSMAAAETAFNAKLKYASDAAEQARVALETDLTAKIEAHKAENEKIKADIGAKLAKLQAGTRVESAGANAPNNWRAALLKVQADHPDMDPGQIWDTARAQYGHLKPKKSFFQQ